MHRFWSKLQSLTLVATLLAPQAQAGMELGRGYLYGRLVSRAEADSNIFANAESNGDLIGTVAPEIGFRRNASLLRLDLSAGAEMQQFLDHSELNATNPFSFASLNWSPEEGKTDGRLSVSARRLSQANPIVNQRTDAEEYLADASFGHFPREKLGYRVRTSYSRYNYLNQGLSDIRKLQAGLDGRFRYSPKLEGFVGYTRRENITYHRGAGQESIESNDDQGVLGLEGDLLPKVRGRLKAGIVHRAFASGSLSSQSGLLLDTEIEWKSRANQSVIAFARRDYDTSPADQTIYRSSFGLETTHQATPKFEVGLGSVYTDEEYRGAGLDRRDRSLSLQVKGTYSFSPRSSGAAALSFTSTDSTLSIANYDRMILTVAWTLRF